MRKSLNGEESVNEDDQSVLVLSGIVKGSLNGCRAR